MSLGNYYYKRKSAYTYNVLTPPDKQALDLAIVKSFLKLNDLDDDENNMLNLLVKSATTMCEKFTKRDLVNKTYVTYRDNFYDNAFLLRRSKVISITSIQYLVSGSWVTLDPATYGLQDVNDFPWVYLKLNQVWPANVDCITQAVKITFVSGYGDCSGINIPEELLNGLLMHVNTLYNNRGDCGGDCSGPMAKIPGAVQALYEPYRIITLSTQERPPLRIY